jgi:hypothetical protein
MKSIAFLTLTAFLFVGSIGVGIFSKVCTEEGTNVSYFVPTENECCKRQAESVEEDCGDCCSKDHHTSEDDCCTVSSELVKLHLDFVNKVQVQPILVPVANVQPVWQLEAILFTEEITTYSGSDPPPKLRQERLTDTQQWLI